MIPSLALIVFAGLSVTVVVTPFVRRLALASNFVDQPAARKAHTVPVPYLGGIAIMAGALGALVVRGTLSPETGVAALSAALLGTIGLFDDHRTLSARARLSAQVLAAGTVLAVGVRAHITGNMALDVLLTVFWIVGITNAVNFLDNMDGLAGGISASAGAAVLVLAAANGEAELARMAAGLTGASLGFLAYNRPPASIFMGDAGSLFLGFMLSVAVLQVDPPLMPPTSFLVPLLLLALPVLDTTVVVVARLRHGRPVGQAGKDHLSHRLAARGLSRGLAVGVLVGVESILAALAVVAGVGLAPLALVAALAAVVVGLVMLLAIPASVYVEEAVALPRRVRLTGAMGVVALAAAVALPLVSNGSSPVPADGLGEQDEGARPVPAVSATSARSAAVGPFTGGHLLPTAGVVVGLVTVNGSLLWLVRRRLNTNVVRTSLHVAGERS